MKAARALWVSRHGPGRFLQRSLSADAVVHLAKEEEAEGDFP